MRSTIIPAQITTVEDKIAGNLNLTQISLLIVPVIFTTIVYSFLPPNLHLAWYKIPLIVLSIIICFALALRIKGKIVLNWLVILLRYNLRPKYYIFDKNDVYLRDLYISEFKNIKKHRQHSLSSKVTKKTAQNIIDIEKLLTKKDYAVTFKQRKGGLHVALEQISD